MLPDIALVAENAALSRLEEIRIRPGIPYLQMMIQKRDEGRLPAHDGDESELVIRSYGGLRVQLHSDGSRIHIFTSKLRDISPFLPGIEKEAMALGRRFIADCELLCYKGDKLSKTELVRFLNRRDGVKKASVKFELAVYDLILLDGDDLTGRPFSLRRRLSGFIHERMHTEDLRDGIFLSASMDADEYAAYDESCRIVRDPSGLYIPGRISRTDRLICGNPSS
jgi:ATP-dependent DNA ligase